MIGKHTPLEVQRQWFERWYKVIHPGTLSLIRKDQGYLFSDIQDQWGIWCAAWVARGEYDAQQEIDNGNERQKANT